MRDKGAFQIRQGDGLTGDRLSGVDPFDVNDHVLDLPILDQVPFRRKGVRRNTFSSGITLTT